MANYSLRVNGRAVTVDSWDPGQPLLYVLRNSLGLHGPKFGCGLSQCGACTVLMDGKAVRSCVTPIKQATGRTITTLEGLGTPANPDRVQAAFITERKMRRLAAEGLSVNRIAGRLRVSVSTVRKYTDPEYVGPEIKRDGKIEAQVPEGDPTPELCLPVATVDVRPLVLPVAAPVKARAPVAKPQISASDKLLIYLFIFMVLAISAALGGWIIGMLGTFGMISCLGGAVLLFFKIKKSIGF